MADSGGATGPTVQAILLATSDSDAFGAIVERTPVEMMPLANQPFIGRVAAWLVGLGVKDITVLAAHRVDLLSLFLGDGSRWGGKFKVVAVGSEQQVYARLPELVSADFALIGHAATLPPIDAAALKKAVAAGGGRFERAGAEALGWSLARRACCGDAVRDCKSLAEFEARLAQAGAPNFEAGAHALRAGSPAALLTASRTLLDGLCPEQLIPGASAEPGIHISRNVVLHPTVRVTPPVVIGADCNIDRGVQLGPYVVVGDKTILGAHTVLENAVVFPGTYIGPHLELKGVVVDHNSLAYGDAKGAVPVPDPFLLSASEGQELSRTLRRLGRRIGGALLLLPLAPLILFIYLLGMVMGMRRPIRSVEAVRLPAASDPALWQTFKYIEFDTRGRLAWQRLVQCLRLTRLPTLWNVATGQVSWVGLRPLTPHELKALPSDWRQLYATGKVGIVRLAEIDRACSGDDSEDQIYSSEAYYVATNGFKTDVAIFWRAVWTRRRGIAGQGPGDRGQESADRNQESGVRMQDAGDRRQDAP